MDKTVSDTVGANVRALRKGRGWTVAQLAGRCEQLDHHISAPMIENIEHGRKRDGVRTRDITVDELIVIADALKVSPFQLLPTLADRYEYAATDAISGAVDATISDLERTAANLRAAMAKVTGRSSQRELDSQ